jgi:hypothetical protein
MTVDLQAGAAFSNGSLNKLGAATLAFNGFDMCYRFDKERARLRSMGDKQCGGDGNGGTHSGNGVSNA